MAHGCTARQRQRQNDSDDADNDLRCMWVSPEGSCAFTEAQRLPSEGTKAPIERHKGFRGKADWMRMKGTEAATEADNR